MQENVLNLILVVMQSVDDDSRAWNMLMLEIIILLLKRETPERMWSHFLDTRRILQAKKTSLVSIVGKISRSGIHFSLFKLILRMMDKIRTQCQNLQAWLWPRQGCKVFLNQNEDSNDWVSWRLLHVTRVLVAPFSVQIPYVLSCCIQRSRIYISTMPSLSNQFFVHNRTA